MKSAFLNQLFTDTRLTGIALVIFFTAFTLMAARLIFSKQARRHCEKMSLLPLQEDKEQV